MATLQVPAPEQPAPLQPSKLEPKSAVAVSTTVTELTKLEEHLFPQSMPDGLLVTVPLPPPALDTDRANSGKVLELFRKTVTVLPKTELVTAKSGLPSRFKSGTASELTPAAAKYTIGDGNVPSPLPRSSSTLASLRQCKPPKGSTKQIIPPLAATRSSLPSPLKSAIATAQGTPAE